MSAEPTSRRLGSAARRIAVACGIVVGAAGVAQGQAEIALPGCEPPNELAGELIEPPSLGRAGAPHADCWRRGVERARELRDRNPEVYDAHRAYVLDVRAASRFLGEEAARAVAGEYEEMAARHPGNPAYPHLLAQLSLDGDAYRKQLDALVADSPDYPWAHLSLAFLGRPGASEAQVVTASRSLERFLEICPGRLAEIGRALEIQSGGEPVAPRLEELRGRALARRDLAALGTLWRLEAHFAGTSEKTAGEARERIAADLAALERDRLPDDLESLTALELGHRVAGDETGRLRIEDRLLALHPCAASVAELRARRYSERFPFDGALPGADREAVAPEATALIDRTLAACPDDTWALARRIQTLRRQPDDRVADLVDAVDRLAAQGSERVVAGAWPELWRAELWLDLGVRLDRVAGLLEADRRSAGDQDDRGADARTRRRALLEARLAAAQGDPDAARDDLGRAEQGTDESPAELRALAVARAEIDLASGDPAQALTELVPWLEESPAAPEVERRAREIWERANPGDAGYASWRASRSRLADSPGAWTSVDLPFPAVPLRDLSGVSWQFPDPAGRVVFLRTWSAWCVPCREEQELLRRLAAKFAGREDIAFAEISVDRTPGDVVEALARSELAYDVLTGGHELLGHGIDAIPSSWIVDRAGRVVRLQVGASTADPDAWLAAARDALREVAGPTPGSPPAG